MVSELVDVMDVIEEIKRLKGISDEEIAIEREKMLEKKGGFANKIFLIWSEKDDYQSNEIKR